MRLPISKAVGTLRTHALVLATLLATGCALSDDEAPADDDDDREASTSSAVAVGGSWKPPAEVLAAGRATSIRYDDAPNWNGGSSCGGSLLAGTRELGDYIKATFKGRVSSYGGYSCRQNTANAKKTSVHGTGRALDLFVPVVGGQADNTKGDEVANWLVRNSASIGVQYVIWDRADWSGNGAGNKMGAYTGPNPHVDHIHVELNTDGASRKTAFFNGARPDGGGPPASECGVNADGVLYCANRPDVPLLATPARAASVVNTLRTTTSWFTCWGTGELHAGRNTTWYRAVGDDGPASGWLPASMLDTSDTFDANPSAQGLKRCD